MLYPVYVHKDSESAYGVTFPDFPGCFSAADDLEELPRLAQEAIEVHFEGEDVEIPPPTALEKLAADPAYQEERGSWSTSISRRSTPRTCASTSRCRRNWSGRSIAMPPSI